jgi:hypothetical protein
MRASLLFILNSFMLFGFGQQSEKPAYIHKTKADRTLPTFTSATNTNPVVRLSYSVDAPKFDIQKVNKNLKLDRRLIISGAVLTGVGGIIFGVGLGSMFGARTDENFLAFALLMTGAPLIGVGVPLLGVGLAQRHKWRQRKNQLNIQTGILSNTHLGLVLNY